MFYVGNSRDTWRKFRDTYGESGKRRRGHVPKGTCPQACPRHVPKTGYRRWAPRGAWAARTHLIISREGSYTGGRPQPKSIQETSVTSACFTTRSSSQKEKRVDILSKPDRGCQEKNGDSGILPYEGAAKGSGEAAREAELAGKKAAQGVSIEKWGQWAAWASSSPFARK